MRDLEEMFGPWGWATHVQYCDASTEVRLDAYAIPNEADEKQKGRLVQTSDRHLPGCKWSQPVEGSIICGRLQEWDRNDIRDRQRQIRDPAPNGGKQKTTLQTPRYSADLYGRIWAPQQTISISCLRREICSFQVGNYRTVVALA